MDKPSLIEISPTNCLDLDEGSAVSHFLGKSKQEAGHLFAKNPLYYLNDLVWMGEIALAYYFPPFLEVFRSNSDLRCEEVLDGVCTVIDRYLDVASSQNEELVSLMVEALEIGINDIVVDQRYFPELRDTCKSLIKRLSSGLC